MPSFIRLLLDVVIVRWNIHGNVSNNLENEIVAALAISDLTHSKLKAAIPERGNRPLVDDKTFDNILEKVCTVGFKTSSILKCFFGRIILINTATKIQYFRSNYCSSYILFPFSTLIFTVF